VAWEGWDPDTSSYEIFVRRFDSSGVPLDPDDVQVNTSTLGDQQQPAVAREPVGVSGRFVVAWLDGGSSIVAQRFSGSGAPVGGEITVSSAASVRAPAVAMDSEANFVVVWGRDAQDGDGYEIRGQRFNASGESLGGEIPVNTETMGDQRNPDVAMDLEGLFVVVWESASQDGSGWGVFGQPFFASGAPAGVEFPVNTETIGHQKDPAVAWGAGESFVVVWQGPLSGARRGIFGQQFGFNGSPIGIEFPVTSSLQSAGEPDVSMAADGPFWVTWSRWDGEGGVVVRRFESDGSPGNELEVNAFDCGSQWSPTVAVNLQDTAFAVAWESYPQDRSGSGVFAQVFPSAATASAAASGASPVLTLAEATSIPSRPAATAPSGGGSLPYAEWPDPTATLTPAAAGGSSVHELAISIYAGGLETYTAAWGYPAEFGFAGFTAIGPVGSTVGWYRLDTDFDGEPEFERPLLSLGDDSAYVDLDDDGDAIGNPMLVRIAGPGPQFSLVAPYGGDGDPGTLTVPVDARITIELMSGILVNPGSPGTYTVQIRLTSVDPDTDDMDDGAGASPLTLDGQLDVFLAGGSIIFADGFESGTTSAWTLTVP
jgi:hypothetical protein